MSAGSAGSAGSAATPGRWWTKRAVVAHVALIVWVPGCAVAAWWQVGIALGGDSLGWVYSVMWPCFAVFGIVFWWFLIHDDPDALGARGLRRARQAAEATAAGAPREPAAPSPTPQPTVAAEEEDPELAAYNAYLADIAGQPKTWRRR